MTSTPRSRPEANWQAEAGVGEYGYAERPTRWVSWILFAGVLLVLTGLLAAMEGLTALFSEQFYAVRPEALLVHADYTVWGWVHLVLGAVAVVTGAGLMRGSRLACVVAVVWAMVSAVVHLAFMPAYPAWSVLVIAFDVLVVYAVTVHGPEVASTR
jgi:hypothetical protein